MALLNLHAHCIARSYTRVFVPLVIYNYVVADSSHTTPHSLHASIGQLDYFCMPLYDDPIRANSPSAILVLQ